MRDWMVCRFLTKKALPKQQKLSPLSSRELKVLSLFGEDWWVLEGAILKLSLVMSKVSSTPRSRTIHKEEKSVRFRDPQKAAVEALRTYVNTFYIRPWCWAGLDYQRFLVLTMRIFIQKVQAIPVVSGTFYCFVWGSKEGDGIRLFAPRGQDSQVCFVALSAWGH